MATYVTGDVHADLTIDNLKQFRNECENGIYHLTKDDYVIVCGDFGLLWSNPYTLEYYHEVGTCIESNPDDLNWNWEELNLLDWYEACPWTTLWVDGNHENFDRLDTYPVSNWHGGRVHEISPSIIHLMRGEIYDIDGYKIFTFGGAQSTDRGTYTHTEWQDIHRCWWPQEIPSEKERAWAHKNLEANGNKVDFIITHDCPMGIKCGNGYRISEVSSFLETIRQSVDFTHWFCGHMHRDEDYGKVSILYDRVLPIEYSVY